MNTIILSKINDATGAKLAYLNEYFPTLLKTFKATKTPEFKISGANTSGQ